MRPRWVAVGRRRPVVSWAPLGLLAGLLLAASPGSAQESRTFTGVVTDELCAVSGHAAMNMGPTDADCARACVDAHEAALVLLDGEHVYTLSDQKQPREFVGTKVRVVGVLDSASGTIRVMAISPA